MCARWRMAGNAGPGFLDSLAPCRSKRSKRPPGRAVVAVAQAGAFLPSFCDHRVGDGFAPDRARWSICRPAPRTARPCRLPCHDPPVRSGGWHCRSVPEPSSDQRPQAGIEELDLSRVRPRRGQICGSRVARKSVDVAFAHRDACRDRRGIRVSVVPSKVWPRQGSTKKWPLPASMVSAALCVICGSSRWMPLERSSL